MGLTSENEKALKCLNKFLHRLLIVSLIVRFCSYVVLTRALFRLTPNDSCKNDQSFHGTIVSFRLRPEKVSRDAEQDERAISKAMQRCNRRRDRCRASNRYWIYFFDFIPMRRSRGGDIARRAYSEITYVPFPGGCSSFGLLPVLRRRSRSFVRLSSSRPIVLPDAFIFP